MPSAEAFGAEDAVGSEVKARSEWTGCVCHRAEAFTPGQEESDRAGVVWRGVAWRGLPERGGTSGKGWSFRKGNAGDGGGAGAAAPGVQSVPEGEPNNRPEVGAGDREPSKASAGRGGAAGSTEGLGADVCGGRDVGEILWVVSLHRRFILETLMLGSFWSLFRDQFPEARDENSPGR